MYILTAAVLFLAALLRLLLTDEQTFEPLPAPIVSYPLSPFADSVYRQEAYYDQLEPGTQCRPKSIFSADLPVTRPITNMPLADEVKRMAAEFDYNTEEVNKGVKYFIQQMADGLAKDGTELSQIPTYVTNVPNGTEKVLFANNHPLDKLTRSRAYIWRSIWVAPTSEYAVSCFTATRHFL